MISPSPHTPAMLSEALEYLMPKQGDVIVDCTIGAAGHSKKILEKIIPGGKLVGIDRDEEILEIAKKELEQFKNNFILKNANFKDIDIVLDELKIGQVDGLLFDLGVSSYQLESSRRGFSFNLDGPLDMRMGQSQKTACELVNFLDKEELADILFRYGQERYSRRIAEAITRERRIKPIETTFQLKGIVLKALPKSKEWRRIHPATRAFQALRIAVNDELDNLQEGLEKAGRILKPGGRVCVISFHSLEDRIAKNIFKGYAHSHVLKILTKKPVQPAKEEIDKNPRARSARLRAAQRIT